jgi:hypothetical protein
MDSSRNLFEEKIDCHIKKSTVHQQGRQRREEGSLKDAKREMIHDALSLTFRFSEHWFRKDVCRWVGGRGLKLLERIRGFSACHRRNILSTACDPPRGPKMGHREQSAPVCHPVAHPSDALMVLCALIAINVYHRISRDDQRNRRYHSGDSTILTLWWRDKPKPV